MRMRVNEARQKHLASQINQAGILTYIGFNALITAYKDKLTSADCHGLSTTFFLIYCIDNTFMKNPMT